MGCDIIGLPLGVVLQAGYVVYCSGESGGNGEGKKGQGGVGLAVCKSISRAEARSPEFVSDRLTALERVVKEVPEHEQLFVFMDTNARTGRRGGGKLGVSVVSVSWSPS